MGKLGTSHERNWPRAVVDWDENEEADWVKQMSRRKLEDIFRVNDWYMFKNLVNALVKDMESLWWALKAKQLWLLLNFTACNLSRICGKWNLLPDNFVSSLYARHNLLSWICSIQIFYRSCPRYTYTQQTEHYPLTLAVKVLQKGEQNCFSMWGLNPNSRYLQQ